MTITPAHPATRTHLPTGLAPLDTLLDGGLADGTLTVVAGLTCAGKTSLICQAARHVTLGLGLPGYYAPLENHEHAAINHILSAETGIEHHRFAAPNRPPFETWELDCIGAAAERLAASALHIDTHARSIADLNTRLRRLNTRPPRIVAIDYPTALADLADPDDFPNQIDLIARGLKAIAQQRGIPALVTCPLTRRSSGTRPQLDDAGEFSGLIEAADTTLILDRPDDRQPYVRIVTAKDHVGRYGSARVYFEDKFVRFAGHARDDEPGWS